MSNQLRGLLITAVGVLLVVPDSLFVRLIDAPPLVIAFWRGLTSGAIILVAVLMTGRLGNFRDVMRTGRAGAAYAVLLGTTTIGFVMAINNTSVANAVFIFATIPIFAGLFSWIFLGEPVPLRLWWTMAVVMLGLAVIAYGSGETDQAHWSGDLWAVYVSAAYAAALTAVRRVKEIPMIPMVPVAYLGSAAALLLWVDPWSVLATQWPWILAHGAFIGAATCFLTIGPRYISAAEVALLILLESVLAPILVWAAVGEDPGRWALVGGAIVIGALVFSNLRALRDGG